MRLARLVALYAALFCSPAVAMQQPADAGAPAGVRLDTDQARLTLELLSARARGEDVDPARWSGVFASVANRRVLEREQAIDERLGLDRGISDESFLAWAQSDDALEALEGRRRTLAAWTTVDVAAAAERAMQYLPSHVRLTATVYPIVRKQSNSFVWDLHDDPAIFMSVGPDVTAEELEMTLVHELHHVGLSGACEDPPSVSNSSVADARGWLSGFAEGLAVLTAAGVRTP
jgi:hypothetical protein